MTREEAKAELKAMRPNNPRKTAGRRSQTAIDVAIETMEAYEKLLRLITEKGYHP